MCFGNVRVSRGTIIVMLAALFVLGIVKVAFGDVPKLPERPKLAEVSKSVVYSENFQQDFTKAKAELFERLFAVGCLKANIYALKDTEGDEVEITAVCVQWR